MCEHFLVWKLQIRALWMIIIYRCQNLINYLCDWLSMIQFLQLEKFVWDFSYNFYNYFLKLLLKKWLNFLLLFIVAIVDLVKITFKKCKGSSVIPKRRFSKSLTTSFAIAYRKQVSWTCFCCLLLTVLFHLMSLMFITCTWILVFDQTKFLF